MEYTRNMAMMATHGGVPYALLDNLGIDPRAVLDLSVNLNPAGPCDAVLQAARSAPIDAYPDPTSSVARAALAESLGVPPGRVVLGNGASELLWSLVNALSHPPRRAPGDNGVVPVRRPAVLSVPAFGEAAAACRALSVSIVPVNAFRQDRFAHPFERLVERVRARQAGLVYLCNPSTPDGSTTDHAQLHAFAEALPDTPIILDESFLCLSTRHADAARPLPDHVIRLRSLTKAFGLPGVRIGYALVPPGLADQIDEMRPAWTVSAAAQAVAVAAPDQEAFLEQSRARIFADRDTLIRDLTSLDLAPYPSEAPYLLFPVENGPALQHRLLTEHHLFVRECTSFGLPDMIRVSVCDASARERLLEALAE